MLLLGAVVGFLIGLIAPSERSGCSLLGIIPASTIIYIAVWQGQNSYNVRSTSALDFLFGPLWPSLGGFGGLLLGRVVRAIWMGGR
jgi:hypothetical protein